MINLSIVVSDISFVLQSYDQIKVYYDTDAGGAFLNEATTVSTRINLIPEQTIYSFTDPTGTTSRWYKVSYYNSTTTDEGNKSEPIQGGTEVEKIGYSFGNYAPPPNEWGKILTADDMRYTYLWGIDATGSDIAETDFEDEQFDFYIREALADFETELTIDIRKRIYKTDPDSGLVRGRYWRAGVDYTDLEDTYPYDPITWQNFGFLQLRHVPVISVERCTLFNPVRGEVINLLDDGWVRLDRNMGQLHMYPTGGQPYGPFASGVLPWRFWGGRFPNAFEVDYTTGYPTAEFVPDDLRSVIGKWACIKCLASIGDGLLAGFSSQSVSLDGLSESFSSTQSATSAYFGARIKQYQDEVKDWLVRNRMKYGVPPLSFVGY